MSQTVKAKDPLGASMKAFEGLETDRRFDPAFPVYARLDGRGFSKFTKGMQKPFDLDMRGAMVETARYLVEKTSARIGYTQSDEISLFWMKDEDGGDIFFNGKSHKMTSVMASLATAKFLSIAMEKWPDRCARNLPVFDCRVCSLPDLEACADMFLWRVLDARKNSISMAAQAHFSHKQLTGVSTRDRIALLRKKGHDWNDLPTVLKEGTWLQRVVHERRLTNREWYRIPEGRRPPRNKKFKRTSVDEIDMPPFESIENKVDVLMGRSRPLVLAETENLSPSAEA